MFWEGVIHIVLVLVALALFGVAAKSYASDKHPRFKWIMLAFGVFMISQIYLLVTAFIFGTHGSEVINDIADLLTLGLFLMAMKS